jgi:hypothetical protein
MRLIIEVEEGQLSRVAQAAAESTAVVAPSTSATGVNASRSTDAGTANGGAPMDELFQALGIAAPPASLTYMPASAAALAGPGAADAINGGAAPDWLWQNAASPKPPTGDVTETAPVDGGSAPK